MNPSILRKGTVQARIAAFEAAKAPKVRKHRILSSLGQVSKMISLFETKKAGERSVNPSSTQVSTKVVKLASVFGPVVGFGDNKKVAWDNFPIPESVSEKRAEDLKAKFSLVTNNSAPMSPQCEGEGDFDNVRRTNDCVEPLDSNTSTKLPVTKQDWEPRTQEFGKKEEAVEATSSRMEPKNIESVSFHHQKSARKTCGEMSGKNSRAPFVKGALQPIGASRGQVESRAIDEIQPNTNSCGDRVNGIRGKKAFTSKKARPTTRGDKSLKDKVKDANTKTPASRAHKPVTASKGKLGSKAVDEIQPNTNRCNEALKGNDGKKTFTSKKVQPNAGRNKSLRNRTRDKNSKSPASRETPPETEARTGRKNVFRRSRNERNPGIRRMLKSGLRALKQGLTRKASSRETPETNQGVTQGKTCTITIESASPISVSWKT